MSSAELTGEKMTIVSVIHQYGDASAVPYLKGREGCSEGKDEKIKEEKRETMEVKGVGRNRKVKKSETIRFNKSEGNVKNYDLKKMERKKRTDKFHLGKTEKCLLPYERTVKEE
jgi:hypothetical protein